MGWLKHVAISLAIGWSAITAAAADPLGPKLGPASHAYAVGDYAKVIEIWSPKARQGDPDAQMIMGSLYENGLGVARDYQQAIQWYKRAAAQGYSQAEFEIGFMLTEGMGSEKDPARAAIWYRRGADHGDGFAQIQLAKSFEAGTGVPQDYVEAYRWYDVARRTLSSEPKLQLTAADAAEKRDKLATIMPAAQVLEAQMLSASTVVSQP